MGKGAGETDEHDGRSLNGCSSGETAKESHGFRTRESITRVELVVTGHFPTGLSFDAASPP